MDPYSPFFDLTDEEIDAMLNTQWYDENKKEPTKKNCECGGEKCRTTHSRWCPKYEMRK